MKEGDFVLAEYTGRVKETGQAFDTTSEKAAKDSGIYDPKNKYMPSIVIVGADMVLRGVEKKLKEMKVGEKKTFVLEPKDAFGERDPKLIKVIPEKEFRSQDITPMPGMVFDLNTKQGPLRGRIISVSSGRAKVDFNSALAGREVEYDVEIKEEVKGEKRAGELVRFMTGIEKVEASVKEKSVEIRTKDVPIVPAAKHSITELLKKWLPAEKVVYIEEY